MVVTEMAVNNMVINILTRDVSQAEFDIVITVYFQHVPQPSDQKYLAIFPQIVSDIAVSP